MTRKKYPAINNENGSSSFLISKNFFRSLTLAPPRAAMFLKTPDIDAAQTHPMPDPAERGLGKP
jgi:hypothetical protein